mgnify:CR=1 FL=1
MTNPNKPQCDMERDCTGAVAYIDNKGFIYCKPHGVERKYAQPCRQLVPWELALIHAGKPIRYERGPKPRPARPMTKAQALQTIDNIFGMAGYTEGQGDLWLATPLTQLKDFIQQLPEETNHDDQ